MRSERETAREREREAHNLGVGWDPGARWARFRTVKLGWNWKDFWTRGGSLECFYSDAFSVQPILCFLIKWLFDHFHCDSQKHNHSSYDKATKEDFSQRPVVILIFPCFVEVTFMIYVSQSLFNSRICFLFHRFLGNQTDPKRKC